jgi:hypothetical protein
MPGLRLPGGTGGKLHLRLLPRSELRRVLRRMLVLPGQRVLRVPFDLSSLRAVLLPLVFDRLRRLWPPWMRRLPSRGRVPLVL